MRSSACLHVTTETANLRVTLKDGGADLVLCASNPLSTQDDVAAALVDDYGIPTYAIKGEDEPTYYQHINAALDHRAAHDDGRRRRPVSRCMHNGAHRTCSRQRHRRHRGDDDRRHPPAQRWQNDGVLKFPVIAVNEADTKHFFDNRYGTGQSTLDGDHPRHQHPAGRQERRRRGYGWCGKGVAIAGQGPWARTSSSPRSIPSAPSRRSWTASG